MNIDIDPLHEAIDLEGLDESRGMGRRTFLMEAAVQRLSCEPGEKTSHRRTVAGSQGGKRSRSSSSYHSSC